MQAFSLLTIDWYRQNSRDLPWRKVNDPYLIWLSEIILQQTKVDQGLAYYIRFSEKYPTVFDLANAQERDVLNLWQGLGYYSRARNLHTTAKFIVDQYNGRFPDNYNELLKLKGVGSYTAAAIASFAYNKKHAVLDGNVYRVLSRVFDIETPIDTTQAKKQFEELANSLIPENDPGEYNQSIMEIGALVCVPVNPKCRECPLEVVCQAKMNNTFRLRPVKSKSIKIKERFFHYMIYHDKGKTILEKRREKDIWQHLYQFPLIEENQDSMLIEKIRKSQINESVERIHVLSHQRIKAIFHILDFIPEELDENWNVTKVSEIQEYPLPRLIDRYLEEENPFYGSR